MVSEVAKVVENGRGGGVVVVVAVVELPKLRSPTERSRLATLASLGSWRRPRAYSSLSPRSSCFCFRWPSTTPCAARAPSPTSMRRCPSPPPPPRSHHHLQPHPAPCSDASASASTTATSRWVAGRSRWVAWWNLDSSRLQSSSLGSMTAPTSSDVGRRHRRRFAPFFSALLPSLPCTPRSLTACCDRSSKRMPTCAVVWRRLRRASRP